MSSSHPQSYTPGTVSVRCQPDWMRIHFTPEAPTGSYAFAGSKAPRSSFSKPRPMREWPMAEDGTAGTLPMRFSLWNMGKSLG